MNALAGLLLVDLALLGLAGAAPWWRATGARRATSMAARSGSARWARRWRSAPSSAARRRRASRCRSACLARRAFPARRDLRVFRRAGQSRRLRRQPLRARLRAPRAGAGAGAAVLSRLPRRHGARAAGRRRLHVPGLLGVHVAGVLGAGDGASPKPGECARGLRLYRDGELSAASLLLLAFGLLAGRAAAIRFEAMRAHAPPPAVAARRAHARADRRRLEGGARAAARLAAARPSGRAEPCLGADERRHDQDRGLRLRAHRVRSAGPAGLALERPGAGAGRGDRADRRA